VRRDAADLNRRILEIYEQSFERRRYCAARFVWRRRRSSTPSGKSTWAAWWTKRFGRGETYMAYVRRLAKERDRK